MFHLANPGLPEPGLLSLVIVVFVVVGPTLAYAVVRNTGAYVQNTLVFLAGHMRRKAAKPRQHPGAVPARTSRLRIVLLSLHYPPTIGGTVTFAVALAEGLAEHANDVTVVVREGESKAVGRAYGLVHRPSLRQLIQLARAADVVHMNGFWFLGALAARIAGAPLVWTHHEYDTSCPIGLGWYRGSSTSFSPLQCVACMQARGLGPHIPRRFVMLFVRRAVARICAANVHPSAYAAARLDLPRALVIEYGIARSTSPQLRPPSKPRFAFVGRLTAEKGCDVLVRAVGQCRERAVDVILEIFGDGPERAHLQGLVADLELADRVLFRGGIDRDRVVDELGTFRAVVVPSVWDEVVGLVALEALAAGVPVIASRVGGLAEVVGDAGLLVPRGDAERLAAALERLTKDTNLARTLGQAGHDRFELGYTQDATVAAHEELYARISSEVVA